MTQAIKLTKGSYSVTINASKVEESINNTGLISIAMPITGSRQPTTSPNTRIWDYKRFQHVISIDGFIEDQTINSSPCTAVQAKNILIKQIFNTANNIQLNWR